jgi:CRISPR-associated protein Cst2
VLLGPDKLSEGVAAKDNKGAKSKNPSITQCLPAQYIDDDLFGFMDASKGGTHKRTSPIRVAPLLAIDPYEGDLDFGTNYMGVDSGGTPNIFETEIHGGLYRGTILIELDAVGKSREGEGESSAKPKEAWNLKASEKAQRVDALLTSLQHLWSTGRQSRYLSDISPKFVAAAMTVAKVPMFLESVQRKGDGLDVDALGEAVKDAAAITAAHCFGTRAGLFDPVPEGSVSVGEAFDMIRGWVKDYYGA